MTTRAKTPAAKRKQLATLIAGIIAVIIVLGAAFLINKLSAGDSGAASASSSKSAATKPSSKPSATPNSANSATSSSSKGGKSGAGSAGGNPSKLPAINASQLPKEAQQTLALIAKGGPFPYDRDGINFGNFEGILPKKAGGYYQEYTVVTPGSSDRGARRIIVGNGAEKYYTDDHYASFSFIQEDQ